VGRRWRGRYVDDSAADDLIVAEQPAAAGLVEQRVELVRAEFLEVKVEPRTVPRRF
jgi:hypothetical protein